MSKFQKFRLLQAADRLLLVEAFLMLPLSSVCLRVFGLKRWHQVLSTLPPLRKSPSKVEAEGSATTKIARLVKAAANHGLWQGSCLEQSLVLWWFLKRRGLVSVIRFGARKEEHELQAHAWVEYAGQALNEAVDVREQYSPFQPATTTLKTEVL